MKSDLRIRKNVCWNGEMKKWVGEFPDGSVYFDLADIALVLEETGLPAPKLKIGNNVDPKTGVVMYFLSGGDDFWRDKTYVEDKAAEYWSQTMKEALDGASTVEDMTKAFYYIKHHIVPFEIKRFVDFMSNDQQKETIRYEKEERRA